MQKGKYIDQALAKLEWIAKLSRENCPEGVPDNPNTVRQLLNQVVIDVRTACQLLSDVSEESDQSDLSDESKRLDPYNIADATPKAAANTLICLANQGIYLLKCQLDRLEQDFVENGGFTERLYRVRAQRRKR